MSKYQTVRWGVAEAASEFSINRRTLANRLKTSGAVPGDDKKFSTKQVCDAVFGSIAGQKLRLLKAQADKTEQQVRLNDRDLIPAKFVESVWNQTIRSLREKIDHSAPARYTWRSNSSRLDAAARMVLLSGEKAQQGDSP